MIGKDSIRGPGSEIMAPFELFAIEVGASKQDAAEVLKQILHRRGKVPIARTMAAWSLAAGCAIVIPKVGPDQYPRSLPLPELRVCLASGFRVSALPTRCHRAQI